MGSSLSLLSSSREVKEDRNWLELPPDVMSLIFTKVGAIDILIRAQFVCSEWRKLCKDPHLFRSIEIHYLYPNQKKLKIAKEAVDRSCGQLVDLSIETPHIDEELLKLIIVKQYPLRRLRFASFTVNSDLIVDIAKKLPLLEELEFCKCHLDHPEKVIVSFGRSCPLLKSFRLIYWNYSVGPRPMHLMSKACDKEALAIAQNMPELRHLNLSCVYLTNNGLKAILDGCPHLNFLHLNLCPHLNFAGGLINKMCSDRNIELRVSGKATLLLELITEMQCKFSGFLELQHKIPDYECIETGYDEELDAASSLYTNALHQTLAQIQSQYDTLSRMESKILSQLKKYAIYRSR